MNLKKEEMETMINQHLPIRIMEKKQYGEVFTPKELIEKMLDTLPENVFCNPNLKWLDPCSGIGNFMILLYFRLFKALELWEPEEEKRSNHIIQNMLYMMELNEENVNICKNIFGSINIVEGNFLEIDIETYFGIKFDIILGNPPFQEISNKGGKNKLYERILLKCLFMSPEYLLFITPDNLFSGGSKAYLKLLEGHVEMISFDKSIKIFFPKIQEYICYFLFKKEDPGQTLIIGNDGQSFECFLRNRPVNPVRNWSQYTEYLVNTYLLDTKNNSVYNRGKTLCEYQISEEGYALIYTPSKYLYTTNKKLAIGLGIKKIIIFAISPNLEFKTDFEGNYGLGPNTFYIPIKNKDEGIKLEKWLNSDIYKIIALSSKTSRQFLKIKFLQHLHLEKIIHF